MKAGKKRNGLGDILVPLDGMVTAHLSPREHRRRTEERARAILAPALERLERAGVPHQAHVAWGQPAKVMRAGSVPWAACSSARRRRRSSTCPGFRSRW